MIKPVTGPDADTEYQGGCWTLKSRAKNWEIIMPRGQNLIVNVANKTRSMTLKKSLLRSIDENINIESVGGRTEPSLTPSLTRAIRKRDTAVTWTENNLMTVLSYVQ